MSTDGYAYGEQLPVPGRRVPAFGEPEPPPDVEAEQKVASPLDRRTEAVLAVAVVTPVVAAYGAIAYGVYALVATFG